MLRLAYRKRVDDIVAHIKNTLRIVKLFFPNQNKKTGIKPTKIKNKNLCNMAGWLQNATAEPKTISI